MTIKAIEFDTGHPKRIECDESKAPFNGEAVLIKLAKGWCEARWEPSDGVDDGFFWVCLDDDFQADWDEPTHWTELPR